MPLTKRQEFYEMLQRVGERRVLYEFQIHRTTLSRWLDGKTEIPGTVMYAMRALAYGPGVDPDWQDWKFRDGYLHSPGREKFTPGDLLAMRYMKFQIDALRRENKQLADKVLAMSQSPAVRGESANDAAIEFVPARQPA